jgi:hypothetical protein
MKREREIKGQRKEGRQCLPDRASKWLWNIDKIIGLLSV